jgi:SAM-dependent methyltransferase
MTDSIPFDRAAEYYDSTRGLSPEGIRATTDALAHVFQGTGRILEVGVGTGQVALPLHQRGVPLAGIDLSRPMLDKLTAKAGGRPSFPLVEGDATMMPFPDDAFGGAFLRWVLHLITDWRAAVREIARVVRPGGPFVAALGSYGGIRSEIQARFSEVTGISVEPVGLTWDGWEQLDAEIAALGGAKLPDIVLHEVERDNMESFVRGIDANMYSWTWAVPDDELRDRAAAGARRYAEERLGRLDAVPRESFEWRFAHYRLG